MSRLDRPPILSQHFRLWTLLLLGVFGAMATSGQLTVPAEDQVFNPRNCDGCSHRRQERDHIATIIVEDLPAHYWQLAKRPKDIEEFRSMHNLTLVRSTPQDAALMPSWPQALVQYILIAPPINCWTSRHTVESTTTTNGVVTSHSSYTTGQTWTPFNVLQIILSPFVFVAWTVSFGLVQAQSQTGGWLSVMGWALWFDLAHILFGPFALPSLLFQWAASLTFIIQRWRSGLGAIAYKVEDLNGCVPVDGLIYLQQGARSRSFKIVQSVTFSVATLFMLISVGDPDGFNGCLAMLALAELIYTAVIANRGTPIIVSGNCLLVELDPRKGFLDSSISTRWKAFSSFMGF